MNVICAIVFGSRYEFDDPEFIAVNKFMTLQTEGFTGTDAIAYLPWLRYLPIKSLKVGLDKLVRCTEIRDPILKKKLDEHRDSMTPETIRDFTDAILKEADNALKEDKSIKNYLTDDHLHMTLLDIFTAGADTTAVTLRWAFVFLCRNPQVQDKIHEELTKVVGSGRLPNLQDRGHLHFLEATMYEILRSSSVAYIGAPHRATRDADLQGFKIPKDTQLMINHWAINNDERYWDAPDEFRPERWLDANNCFTPGNHKSYLPFSAGRRGCIGESWAKTELFIILSQLMYRYKIIKARDKPLPSLEGIFGIVVAPVDFHIAVVHRCRIQDTN